MVVLLVWLNGTFAVGKTSTAASLSSLWPGSIVLDPEEIGVGLRAWTPEDAWVRDFQDLQLWRDLVVTTCQGVLAEWGRPVIVPMTVLDPAYFEDTVGRLRAAGVDVRHFCLVAPGDVLLARARRRSHLRQDHGDRSWMAERWQRHDALDDRFQEHVDTAARSVLDVAQHIASRLPHPLPSRTGQPRWRDWRTTTG